MKNYTNIKSLMLSSFTIALDAFLWKNSVEGDYGYNQKVGKIFYLDKHEKN